MTILFWKSALIRALKTFCQTAVSLLAVSSISGVLDADWVGVLSASALAGVISILTSIATGLPEVDDIKTEGTE